MPCTGPLSLGGRQLAPPPQPHPTLAIPAAARLCAGFNISLGVLSKQTGCYDIRIFQSREIIATRPHAIVSESQIRRESEPGVWSHDFRKFSMTKKFTTDGLCKKFVHGTRKIQIQNSQSHSEYTPVCNKSYSTYGLQYHLCN